MIEPRLGYAHRRPYLVVETLDELVGPVSGMLDLPPHLDWSEQRRYDLGDPRQRGIMYERVLREAMTVEDLRTYLNGNVLVQVWPQLFLPARVRQLWESRFAELTRRAA